MGGVVALPPTAGVKLAIRIAFISDLVLEDKAEFWGDGVQHRGGASPRSPACRFSPAARSANRRVPPRTSEPARVMGRDRRSGAARGGARVSRLMGGDADDSTQFAGLASSASGGWKSTTLGRSASAPIDSPS